jgi:hypothetical protein
MSGVIKLLVLAELVTLISVSAHAQSGNNVLTLGSQNPATTWQNYETHRDSNTTTGSWLPSGFGNGASLDLGAGLSIGFFSNVSAHPFDPLAMGLGSGMSADAVNGLSMGPYDQRRPLAPGPWDSSSVGGGLSMDLGHGLSVDFLGGLTRNPGYGLYTDPRGGPYLSPGGALSTSVSTGLSMDLGGGTSVGLFGTLSSSRSSMAPCGASFFGACR